MKISLLAQQSPKTYGWLRRTIDQGGLARIDEAYNCAIALGADDERHLNRTEGASYNPRPARLILLLSQEGGCRDPHPLGAAAFLPIAGQFETLSNVQSDFLEEIELARTALTPKEVATLSHGTRKAAHDLHLVWQLDTLRHLHMQHRSADELRTALDNLQLLREELPLTSESRLQVLVDAHIERLRRQL